MLAIVELDENISFFSENGVIALMFMAGLESDLSKVKKYFLPAVSVALLGAAVPLNNLSQVLTNKNLFWGYS